VRLIRDCSGRKQSSVASRQLSERRPIRRLVFRNSVNASGARRGEK
jgi:hypothetical protein